MKKKIIYFLQVVFRFLVIIYPVLFLPVALAIIISTLMNKNIVPITVDYCYLPREKFHITDEKALYSKVKLRNYLLSTSFLIIYYLVHILDYAEFFYLILIGEVIVYLVLNAMLAQYYSKIQYQQQTKTAY